MDKDHRVSRETRAQFDISVGTVHTIIRKELKMRKICTKFVPRVPREDQKERHCHDSREMVELINSDPRVLDALVTGDESWIYCYDPETKRQSSQWKHAGSPRPKKAREQTHPQTFDDNFLDSTGMIYMYWVSSGQTVNKEYYVEVLREFRMRFRRKRPAQFKSGQWHFHQDNAPVHNSILVTDYLTKMSIKTVPHTPYIPDLAPCDFCLFPKLRGCRHETIEEMKEAVTKVIDKLTQGLQWGLPEVVGMVQVHCSWRRLLRRGLELHVCTINKSAHTKKSGNLLKAPHIFETINSASCHKNIF